MGKSEYSLETAVAWNDGSKLCGCMGSKKSQKQKTKKQKPDGNLEMKCSE